MAGLANLSEFFENPLFTETIREVPVETAYIGTRFLPIEETYDIDFNESVIERQVDMADLVDSGAELPLTDRDPMRRVSGSILDMGQSYIVSKKELAAMMDKGNDAKRNLAVKQLLNKTAQIKKNLDARIEWLRWQALGTGVFAYDKAGIKLAVDFGVPAANKVTPTVKWDAGSGVTIIDNYEKWVQDYVDLNGVKPDTFVAGIAIVRTMMNDSKVREAVSGLPGKLITLAELNAWLTGRELPPVEAFDASVVYRDPTTGGTRSTVRLLDAKKGVFLKSGGDIGKQLLGPTYEGNMEPGIVARTFTMERPVREVIEVVGASFPKIQNPKLIKIATVLA